MSSIKINVGELRGFIKENQEKFKPVVGKNVVQDDKTNNSEYYKDATDKVKKYDGGLKDVKKKPLPDKLDNNRTTLGYNPVNEPSKEYKERVKAQAMGYTSELERKNGNERADEYDDDARIFNQFTKSEDRINKAKVDFAHSGLQARELEKDKKNTVYESQKPKAKRLLFKHTTFINEAHMLSRIPDEYKKDGQTIYMEDSKHNEYIVECTQSKFNGHIETKVVNFNNKETLSEQMKRVQSLMDYDTTSTNGKIDYTTKVEENTRFTDIMNIARQHK